MGEETRRFAVRQRADHASAAAIINERFGTRVDGLHFVEGPCGFLHYIQDKEIAKKFVESANSVLEKAEARAASAEAALAEAQAKLAALLAATQAYHDAMGLVQVGFGYADHCQKAGDAIRAALAAAAPDGGEAP